MKTSLFSLILLFLLVQACTGNGANDPSADTPLPEFSLITPSSLSSTTSASSVDIIFNVTDDERVIEVSWFCQLGCVGNGLANNLGNNQWSVTDIMLEIGQNEIDITAEGANNNSITVIVTRADISVDTIFVDGSLASDCPTYDPDTRNCTSNGPYQAFNTLQAAADEAMIGDVVLIREGVYQNTTNNCIDSGFCQLLRIQNSGAPNQPINYSNYGEESVVLRGFGFEDYDLNSDGFADGAPANVNGVSVNRETLVIIDADYIHIRGFEITNSAYQGMSVRGSYNRIENVSIHDNWGHGLTVGMNTSETKMVEGNVLNAIEAYRQRHGSGILMGRSGPGNVDSNLNYTRNNTIENSLFYFNGYQPNSMKVLPIPGDPAGGGNSDAISLFKSCKDAATNDVSDWCPDNIFRNNLGFGNADDGFDISSIGSFLEDNIAFNNGPEGERGFKVLRRSADMTFRGNIAMDQYIGFEARIEEGAEFYFYNNLSLRNTRGLVATDQMVAKNNWALLNLSDDSFECTQCTNNSVQSIDTHVPNLNFIVDTNFPSGLSIEEKHAFIKDQFAAALTPISAQSVLVDQGEVIPGYHCSAPGFQPGECRQWYGDAPDIGPFEYEP